MTIRHFSEPPKSWAREESETGFTKILDRLVSVTPGAIGAAIVDSDGEAVDYAAPSLEPFELKIAAAHWRIVLQDLERGPLTERGGSPRRLVIRTTKRSFVLDALPDGYALLTVLHRNAAFAHADRAIDGALRDLYGEAGWKAPPGLFRWYPIEVKTTLDRPIAVRLPLEGRAFGWVRCEVIGKVVVGLERGEIGWRVGFESLDHELTVVHGRDDKWYSDAPPAEISGDASRESGR